MNFIPYFEILKYMKFGRYLTIFIIIVKVFGKCISNEFDLVNPLKIFSAAKSTDLSIGILKVFLSVIGVLIKPGLITDTLTLYLNRSKNRLSAKVVKADFDEQYAPAAGNPLYPATEETIEICPLFLFLK